MHLSYMYKHLPRHFIILAQMLENSTSRLTYIFNYLYIYIYIYMGTYVRLLKIIVQLKQLSRNYRDCSL